MVLTFLRSTDFMGDMALGIQSKFASTFTHIFFSFGGGFELMRDGGDKEGFWTTLESGMK